METVETMNGTQTFAHSSTKVYIFALEQGVGKRTFLNQAGTMVGRPNKISAAKDAYAAHGAWHRNVLQLPDGTVMLITANQTREGAGYADTALILRRRETGPLLRVNIRMCSDPNAVMTELPAFTGRADILSVDEAKEYGYSFEPGYIKRFFDPEDADILLDISELAPQVAQPPEKVTVDVGQGEKRAVAIPSAPGRRIRTRRR